MPRSTNDLIGPLKCDRQIVCFASHLQTLFRKSSIWVSACCFRSSSVTLHACWFLFALSCCTLYKNPLYAPAPHPRHIFPLIPLPPFPFHCCTRTLRIPSGGKKMELNSHSSFFFFYSFAQVKAYSLKTPSAPHWCALPSSASSLLQETNWGLLTWWTFRRFITSCRMNCSQIIVVIKAG